MLCELQPKPLAFFLAPQSKDDVWFNLTVRNTGLAVPSFFGVSYPAAQLLTVVVCLGVSSCRLKIFLDLGVQKDLAQLTMR